MLYDVVIVGAGPAGCFTGKLLAERGFDVAIIEEHAEIGHPACCAGIVGTSGLRELGIKPGKWAVDKLKGAVFYPPSGNAVTLDRRKIEALVIDRASFDRELAVSAIKAGATLLMKTRCFDISLGREAIVGVEWTGGRDEVKARLVIGADGPTSLVARKAGLLKSPRYTSCAQVEAIADVEASTAELYFGRAFAPGFFAWIVPAGDVCRIGIGTSEGSPLRRLIDFMKKHPIASKKIDVNKVVHFTAGLIPQPLTRKIYADNVMLVGDAAGHVKPLTGGGIYLGLSCAKLAADVATEALEDKVAAKTLHKYERAVKKRFGAEFRLGLYARKVPQKMSDDDLNSTFELLARPDVRTLVLEHADFDHHGELIKALAKKGPSLLRLVGLHKLMRYTHKL